VTWFKFEDYGHFVHVHKNAIFKQMEEQKLYYIFQTLSFFQN
jgi:hypothetical protein